MLWSQKEIKYLINNYVKEDISFSDMIDALQKSKKAICHKAARLGLSRPKSKNKIKKRRQWDQNYYHKNKTQIKLNEKRRQKELLNYLKQNFGNKCLICGFNKYQSSLDFHHINGDKFDNISSMIGKASKQKIFDEVRKCILICSNCHRAIHSGELVYSAKHLSPKQE